MAWPFSQEDDGRWNVVMVPEYEDEPPKFWDYEGESEEDFVEAWLER